MEISANASAETTSKALALQSLSKSALSVLNSSSSPGRTAEVVIRLQARGDENALGFTLNFNPGQLSFLAANVQNLPGNAVSLINTDQSNSGELGIFLALPAGTSFPVGTYDLLRVSFRVSASAAAATTIAFSDAVVFQEVSSVQGAKIPATFSGGTLSLAVREVSSFRLRPPTFLPSGTLQFQIEFRDGRPLSAEKVAGLQLWASSQLSAPSSSWTKLIPAWKADAGLLIVNDPAAAESSARFYRLAEEP